MEVRVLVRLTRLNFSDFLASSIVESDKLYFSYYTDVSAFMCGLLLKFIDVCLLLYCVSQWDRHIIDKKLTPYIVYQFFFIFFKKHPFLSRHLTINTLVFFLQGSDDSTEAAAFDDINSLMKVSMVNPFPFLIQIRPQTVTNRPQEDPPSTNEKG